MTARTSLALRNDWPAFALAAALFGTIFVDTTTHPELAATVFSAAVAGSWIVALAREERHHVPMRLAASLGALIGWMALRAFFAPEPLVAFGGAYSSDGTVYSLAVFAVALFGAWQWNPDVARGETPGTGKRALAVFIIIAVYAAASAIAAWQWDKTDPSGGPPSGFTANSQLQLQVLTAGLTAALAWAALRRTQTTHLVGAVTAVLAIVVGIVLCRSSVTVPAYAIGAVAALIVHRTLDRIGAKRLALGAVSLTGLMAAGLVAAFSIPGVTERAIPLLNRLGNGRGTLWGSAAEALSDSPIVGIGLGHSTAITSWIVNGPGISHVSTNDPHSMLFLLAAGGGLVGVALALYVAYVLVKAVLDRLTRASGPQRLVGSIVLGGSVALFVLAQFSFVYTLAWMLMLFMVGLVLRDDRDTVPARPRGPRLVVPAVAAVLVVASLISCVWITLPGRAQSTRALFANISGSTPAESLADQLACIRNPWDLFPAEMASLSVVSWGRGDPAEVASLRAAYDTAYEIVSDALTWDARLIAARMHVWAIDAENGRVDPAELARLVDAGVSANPSSGFWAVAGCSLARTYGMEQQAGEYARDVTRHPTWWYEAGLYADADTRAYISQVANSD